VVASFVQYVGSVTGRGAQIFQKSRSHLKILSESSGYRRDADGSRALAGYSARSGDSFLPFRDNLSGPYSRVKNLLVDY